jgi:hypothetical protein
LVEFVCLKRIQAISSCGCKIKMDIGRHKYSVNTSIYLLYILDS